MKRHVVSVLVLLAAVVGAEMTGGSQGRSLAHGISYQAARGNLHPHLVRFGHVLRPMPMLSAGTRVSAVQAYQAQHQALSGTTLPARVSLGCGNRTSAGDARVNQDCGVQRQAEEDIAYNPLHPKNLIAGQNDSSIGWNHCGFDYSLDSGRSWGSGIPPFYQRLNHPPRGHTIAGGHGSGHTYDAASDPSVAFDAQGNAYFSCVLFDVNGNANGLLVTRSPAAAKGSFYNTVPAGSPHYVVVEDNKAAASVDKEFITTDTFSRSPYRDTVYVTWTEFISSPNCRGGVCFSSIYFSRSRDHGLTWSKPTEISGSSRALCFGGNAFDPRRSPHACDFDQGSQSMVLPNGNIVVVFNNGNTRNNNPNLQQLAVISRNGGTSWSSPVFVGRDIITHEPNCNFGEGPEECVPGSYVRVDDFPRATLDRSNGRLYAVWNDYRDHRFDIRLSESTNGGRIWRERPHPIESLHKDAYMADIGVSATNHDVAVGFYTTGRVHKERNHKGVFKPGTGGVDARTSTFRLAVSRRGRASFTVSSISPRFRPPNGIQIGFNGDYSGITVIGNVAHPIWSDTRNHYRAHGKSVNDEDIFTTTRTLP